MKSFILLVVFAAFANGRVLECNYEVSTWPLLGQLYSCRATIVDTGNPSFIQEIRGVHLSGRDNSQVEGFSLTEQRFGEIPRNLAAFFSKLKAVDFTNAQILTLSFGDLTSLTSLRFLRLFNNKISTLGSDSFKSNSQLQYIDFAGNLLQSVGENLLGDLPLLTAADFSRNPCIDVQAFTRLAVTDLNQILPIRCATPVTTTAASTSTSSTAKTSPVITTTTSAASSTTSAALSTTSAALSTSTGPVPTSTSPVSTSTVSSTSILPTVSSVTTETSPTASTPTTTTEIPKQCTVSCSELQKLEVLVEEQAVIIAYLEERLRVLESM